MKKSIMFVLAGLLLVSSAEAGTTKATICHKDTQTLQVGEPALSGHLAHGDCVGPCPCAPEPECAVNEDCQLVPSFCGGCECLALPVGEPAPECDNPVLCFVDPCQVSPFTAFCNDGICDLTDVLCTLDVMECPDGTVVSRVPPSCEFAPCPAADPN